MSGSARATSDWKPVLARLQNAERREADGHSGRAGARNSVLVAAQILEVAVDRRRSWEVVGWRPGEDRVELVERSDEDGEVWQFSHLPPCGGGRRRFAAGWGVRRTSGGSVTPHPARKASPPSPARGEGKDESARIRSSALGSWMACCFNFTRCSANSLAARRRRSFSTLRGTITPADRSTASSPSSNGVSPSRDSCSRISAGVVGCFRASSSGPDHTAVAVWCSSSVSARVSVPPIPPDMRAESGTRRAVLSCE